MKLQQRNDGKFLLVLTDEERTKLVQALFEAANLLPEIAGDLGAGLDASLRRRAKQAASTLRKTLHVVDRPT